MSGSGRWLLLVHQIPGKPDYLRVKIGRRLARIGSVALKKTVYALPRSETAREDFDWICSEITSAGGDAMVIDAELSTGMTDADVEERFRRAREHDYVELGASVRALARSIRRGRIAPERRRVLLADVARMEKRLDDIGAIDFFGAPSSEPTRALVADLRRRLEVPVEPAAAPVERLAPPRGATWVTRAGVHVDRIASAWLIRRFIDPEAVLRTVPAKGYVPEPGVIRFDMDAGEHTHEGDDCTFEVLCRRFALGDPGLRAIGEIVHDLDLKDAKFERPETEGVATMITGIALVHRDDPARIEAGSVLFDALLAALARRGGRKP